MDPPASQYTGGPFPDGPEEAQLSPFGDAPPRTGPLARANTIVAPRDASTSVTQVATRGH